MLSTLILVPLVAALALALIPPIGDRAAAIVWVSVAALETALIIGIGATWQTPEVGTLAYEQRADWIPGLGSSYHVGIDGISLALLALTVVAFLASSLFALIGSERARTQAAWFLFLEAVSVGVFVAQDLLVFFVFFDLSIVGMYFVIAGWGHGRARRSAAKFFLYTFLGSLAMLGGFIGLYLGADPHTFDIPELIAARPWSAHPAIAVAVLAAIVLGLAIKTPVFPFHTWLPSAHTDAPTVGSVVLAAVLLKLGTYGFIRVALLPLPGAWTTIAPYLLALGIISVLYGALVALGQSDLKRMIAYTSVNHMGYILVGLAAAGLAGADATDRSLAITGAVTQMVSHGLLTGALFLLVGVLAGRTGVNDHPFSAYGGIAARAPAYAALLAVAFFGSLGIPGLSGFIAELQIFAGSIGASAWAALALPGIVIVAALSLLAFSRVATGPEGTRSGSVTEIRGTEATSVLLLLVPTLIIGVYPGPLLSIIRAGAAGAVAALGG